MGTISGSAKTLTFIFPLVFFSTAAANSLSRSIERSPCGKADWILRVRAVAGPAANTRISAIVRAIPKTVSFMFTVCLFIITPFLVKWLL
jgi:hypothetical protein